MLQGQKMSAESRLKMSLAKKGKPSPNKGKKASEQTRKKLSESHKGYVMPEEQKRKIGLASLGFRHSLETIKKMSESRKGEKNPMWEGGKTQKHLLIRMSLEYRLWRESVFKRDNYTCVWCGDNSGGNLNADHIKPFRDYPELRFAIDNGRTLCVPCHRTTETWGRPKK